MATDRVPIQLNRTYRSDRGHGKQKSATEALNPPSPNRQLPERNMKVAR